MSADLRSPMERRRDMMLAAARLRGGPVVPVFPVSGLTAARSVPALPRTPLSRDPRARRSDLYDAGLTAARVIEALPDGCFDAWHWKLMVAGALLWDYVATVCDLAASENRTELRATAREMRHLSEKYYRTYEDILRRDFMRKADGEAANMEEWIAGELKEMTRSLREEMMCCGVKERDRYFQTAVAQARAVLMGMEIFGLCIDRRMERLAGPTGAPACVLVDSAVLALRPLLRACADKRLRRPGRALARASRLIGEALCEAIVNTDHGEWK